MILLRGAPDSPACRNSGRYPAIFANSGFRPDLNFGRILAGFWPDLTEKIKITVKPLILVRKKRWIPLFYL